MAQSKRPSCAHLGSSASHPSCSCSFTPRHQFPLNVCLPARAQYFQRQVTTYRESSVPASPALVPYGNVCSTVPSWVNEQRMGPSLRSSTDLRCFESVIQSGSIQMKGKNVIPAYLSPSLIEHSTHPSAALVWKERIVANVYRVLILCYTQWQVFCSYYHSCPPQSPLSWLLKYPIVQTQEACNERVSHLCGHLAGGAAQTQIQAKSDARSWTFFC